MEGPRTPKVHPGWTLILIAVFLLVLTLILILTHHALPEMLITLLLPFLALTGLGVLWLVQR